ncbi:MAG: hypothetical protein AOA65_1740 [Candidatus Bathyarchaeota archaeon BA1]|nr:MAG: hypothetical protein AOA65_1740 [Candidatus Bathyarchaeota archaeon BA1]
MWPYFHPSAADDKNTVLWSYRRLLQEHTGLHVKAKKTKEVIRRMLAIKHAVSFGLWDVKSLFKPFTRVHGGY